MLWRGGWLWLLLGVTVVAPTPLRERDDNGRSRFEYDVKHPSGSSSVKVRLGSNSGGSYRPLNKPHHGSDAQSPPTYAEGHSQAASHLYPTYDAYSKYPSNHGHNGHANVGYSYPHGQYSHGPGPSYGSVPLGGPAPYGHGGHPVQQASHDLPPRFDAGDYRQQEVSRVPLGVHLISGEVPAPQVLEQAHVDKAIDFPSAAGGPAFRQAPETVAGVARRNVDQGQSFSGDGPRTPLLEQVHVDRSIDFPPDADLPAGPGFRESGGAFRNVPQEILAPETVRQERVEQTPVVQNVQLSQDVYEPKFSDIGKPSIAHQSVPQRPNYRFVPVGEPYERFSHSTEVKHAPVLSQRPIESPQQQVLVDLANDKPPQPADGSLSAQKHIEVGPSFDSAPNRDYLSRFPHAPSHSGAFIPAQHSVRSPYRSNYAKQPSHVVDYNPEFRGPQPFYSVNSAPPHFNEIPPPPPQKWWTSVKTGGPPAEELPPPLASQDLVHIPIRPSQELVHDIATPSHSRGVKSLVPQSVKLPPPTSQELLHDVAVAPPTHSVKSALPQTVKLPPPSHTAQELVHDAVLPPPPQSVKTIVSQSVKLPRPPSQSVKTAGIETVKLPPPSQEVLRDVSVLNPPNTVKAIAQQTVKLPPPLPSQELVHVTNIPSVPQTITNVSPQSVKLPPPPTQELVQDIVVPQTVKTVVPQSVKLPPPPTQELVGDIVVPQTVKTVVPQSVKLPPTTTQELVHDIVVPQTVQTVVPQSVKLPPTTTQELVHDIVVPQTVKTVVPQSVNLPPTATQEFVRDIVVPTAPETVKTVATQSVILPLSPPLTNSPVVPTSDGVESTFTSISLDAPVPELSFIASAPAETDSPSVRVQSSGDGSFLENSLVLDTIDENLPSISTDLPKDSSVPNLFAGVPSPSGQDIVQPNSDQGREPAEPASLPVPEALVSRPQRYSSNSHGSGESENRQRFPSFPVESALKQQDPVSDRVSDLSQGYRRSAGYDAPRRGPAGYDGPNHGPAGYDGPNHGPVGYDGPNRGPADYDDEESASPDVKEARFEVDRISKEIGSSFGLRLPGFN